jgi:hypothetical protein
MPALVAGIHVFCRTENDVDGRDKPGRDGARGLLCQRKRHAAKQELVIGDRVTARPR